jgi:hypothetical protein
MRGRFVIENNNSADPRHVKLFLKIKFTLNYCDFEVLKAKKLKMIEKHTVFRKL